MHRHLLVADNKTIFALFEPGMSFSQCRGYINVTPKIRCKVGNILNSKTQEFNPNEIVSC